MTKKTKTLLAIAIIGSAIGGLIVIATVKTMRPVLALVKSLLEGTWHLLTSTLSLPVWLILVGASWILFTLYLIAKVILLRAIEPQPYTYYFRDEFWGLTWMWTYSGRTIDPPWCYCPSCETQLICVITAPPFYDTTTQPRIAISCERCHRTLYEDEGDLHTVQGQIARQIERRIRTGEWKQVVERNLKAQNSN